MKRLDSWLLHRYWGLRHWLWDQQRFFVVRYIAKQMKHNDALYVHPYESHKATWVILPVEKDRSDHELMAPHDHLEGPKQKK